MTASELEIPKVPNLEGSECCVNPQCQRELHNDYVPLVNEEAVRVKLCWICWTTRIDELPHAAKAVAKAEMLQKMYGPPIAHS